MSAIQEIDVYILPDGTVKIGVRGVKGQKCVSLTEGVVKALGGEVLEREHTDEFYQDEQTQSDAEQVKQQGK